MTVFIFWCLCFVGMFVAGVVTDWLDARTPEPLISVETQAGRDALRAQAWGDQ